LITIARVSPRKLRVKADPGYEDGVSGAFSSIGFALSTSIAVAAARVRRVATAFAAAARRFRVVAAFLPAARRLRVAAALLPAARRFRVIADFFAAALRFRATFVLLAADDAIPINSFATPS